MNRLYTTQSSCRKKKHLFDYTKSLGGFVFFCRETIDAILNKKRITEVQEKEIYVVQYFTDKKERGIKVEKLVI